MKINHTDCECLSQLHDTQNDDMKFLTSSYYGSFVHSYDTQQPNYSDVANYLCQPSSYISML